MKAPDPTDSFDSLSRVLQDWRVVPARAPQFRAEVWARIEGTKKTESWPGYLRGHAAAVAGALALAVVVGALGGRSQARALAAAESARLASAYVQGMDARAIVMR
ncbi:MAG: hypothetical protein RLZZ162_4261 [Verrucomicrobiota bacterium]|jgi:hypothetical protein